MNIVVKVAYDGTRFYGWQKAESFVTIESELENAVTQILQHPVELQAASRTDRGVHALGQVVNFHTDKECDLEILSHGLNALLPPDIRILSIHEGLPDFHATLSSRAKEYRYEIFYGKTLMPFKRLYTWHFPHPLDIEKMRIGADILLGEHDFKAFRNNRKGIDYNDTVRSVYSIDVVEHEESLTIKMTANNFLYKMARNIAGTLAYIGANKLTCGMLSHLLTDGTRPEAGMTAPACGLTLHKVFYTFPPEISSSHLI